jgi:hypothetical protein
VSSYRDLEPGLVGAMEELIDFVAPPAENSGNTAASVDDQDQR